MNPVIRFEHVSKKYKIGLGRQNLRETISRNFSSIFRNNSSTEEGIFWALKDVNFQLEPGKALGLVGPNGAGKTTILKILAKITQPSMGSVNVMGRVSELIELGAGFHPELTGRENIELNGSILGLSRKGIARKFDEIVSFSGLEKFIDTPVKRYSSGMYVRLGFSVAAHIDPDILLVDEVLAVGDSQFRQKCAVRIDELKESGTTIVFVAHNLYLVKSVCDTAIFMADGQIQEHGDVLTAIQAYERWIHHSQWENLSRNGHFNDPSENSFVSITNVEIRNLNENRSDEFNFQDPVEVNIYYQVQESIKNPNLALRFMRADGTTCCIIRTDDYGYSLDNLDGNGVITVGINPLQLSGGVYAVEAKIMMSSIDGMRLAIGHSSWFTVIGMSLSHAEASGVFVPQVAFAEVKKGKEHLHLQPSDT